MHAKERERGDRSFHEMERHEILNPKRHQIMI